MREKSNSNRPPVLATSTRRPRTRKTMSGKFEIKKFDPLPASTCFTRKPSSNSRCGDLQKGSPGGPFSFAARCADRSRHPASRSIQQRFCRAPLPRLHCHVQTVFSGCDKAVAVARAVRGNGDSSSVQPPAPARSSQTISSDGESRSNPAPAPPQWRRVVCRRRTPRRPQRDGRAAAVSRSCRWQGSRSRDCRSLQSHTWSSCRRPFPVSRCPDG